MRDSSDLTFFLGAGASAPFGIPTMKQLVVNFEEMLENNGTDEELNVFRDIKNTLENVLQRPTDLEDVFTVIDGIINYGLDRIGLLAAYSSIINFTKIPSQPAERVICVKLQKKFENFIRRECMIPEKSFPEIFNVYQDLYTKISASTQRSSSNTHLSRGTVRYCTWTIFTTNYDTCLEYFWRERVRANLYTGFRYDQSRHTQVLDTVFKKTNDLTLVKLHGSLNWMLEPDGTIVEEIAPPGRSYIGRTYEGPMMIYPIQQKELYLEPYVSMFSRLNRELQDRMNWVIIGYSFNDPIVREIFLKNSDDGKRIVFLHPHADDVIKEHLSDLRGEIFPLKDYFGQHEKYQNVNQEIVDNLE